MGRPKGGIPWNKGKKFEYKPRPHMRGRRAWNKGLRGAQVSFWKGKKRSEEFKENLRQINTGKKHSEETKRKIRIANIGKHRGGRKPGWHHSPETKEKISKAKRGDKSHFWRGGKTKETTRLRSSGRYRAWRKSVFERDGYMCQVCNQIGGSLNAHHIKEVSHHPELSLAIDNGITLCEPCHKLTDNFGAKKYKKIRAS